MSKPGHSYHRTNALAPGCCLILVFSLLAACLALPLVASASGGFPILAVLRAGNRPEGIAVDTQTHLVYIAYEFPGLVVAFDPIHGQLRWQATVGDTAIDIQVDSVSHNVYVISSQFQAKQSLLTILDGASGKKLLTASANANAAALAIDPSRRLVYVASPQDGVINVYSLVTNPQTGELSAGASYLYVGQQPSSLAVNSRLGRLYVGDAKSNVVSVVDEESGGVIAIIPVAADPVQPLRVNQANGRVYVVCSVGQELDIIDGKSNRVIARVPVFPYPEGVDFNTATGRIYVAGEGNPDASNSNNGTTITVIDGQSLSVLGTLEVGRAPDGVAADPLLRRVYVSAEDSNTVVEISDSTDLPLSMDGSYAQVAAARHAISLLQTASTITIILMLATVAGATINALLAHRRSRQAQNR